MKVAMVYAHRPTKEKKKGKSKRQMPHVQKDHKHAWVKLDQLEIAVLNNGDAKYWSKKHEIHKTNACNIVEKLKDQIRFPQGSNGTSTVAET